MNIFGLNTFCYKNQRSPDLLHNHDRYNHRRKKTENIDYDDDASRLFSNKISQSLDLLHNQAGYNPPFDNSFREFFQFSFLNIFLAFFDVFWTLICIYDENDVFYDVFFCGSYSSEQCLSRSQGMNAWPSQNSP